MLDLVILGALGVLITLTFAIFHKINQLILSQNVTALKVTKLLDAQVSR